MQVKATGPHGITDAKLRELFAVADKDDSGTVSIAELTKFVWGNENLLQRDRDGTAISSSAAEHAAPAVDELSGLHMRFNALAMPGNTEPWQAFDRLDVNRSGTLSLAEIDKAVVELWPEFDHKKALMVRFDALSVTFRSLFLSPLDTLSMNPASLALVGEFD